METIEQLEQRVSAEYGGIRGSFSKRKSSPLFGRTLGAPAATASDNEMY